MKNIGNSSPSTLLGLGLIILAVLLFFKNIGFSFFGVLFHNWPIALIIVGGLLLLGPEKVRQQPRTFLPFALIGFGVLFFLAQRGIFNLSFGAIFAPLILIFVGMHVLKPTRNRCFFTSNNNKSIQKIELSNNKDESSDEAIDIFTVLGGGNYVTRAQNLGDGSIVCVLGGADIDIREAECKGDVIKIDVLAFMGGAEIKIPPHWQITVDVLPLLGGVSNKTTCLAEKMGVPKKHLVVTGLAFMGGLEIRN